MVGFFLYFLMTAVNVCGKSRIPARLGVALGVWCRDLTSHGVGFFTLPHLYPKMTSVPWV